MQLHSRFTPQSAAADDLTRAICRQAKTPANPVEPAAPHAAGSAGDPGTVDPKLLALDGLYLAGKIIGRQRREFPGSNGKPTRYAITLTVLTKSGVHKPERWSDTPAPSDVPLVGDHVCLQTRISIFTSKGGGTGYRLNWGPETTGTEF